MRTGAEDDGLGLPVGEEIERHEEVEHRRPLSRRGANESKAQLAPQSRRKKFQSGFALFDSVCPDSGSDVEKADAKDAGLRKQRWSSSDVVWGRLSPSP